MDRAVDQVTALLRQRHKITEGEDDDFSVRNLSEMLATAEAQTRIMAILLGSVASVSLLVGGIGIMNIMLVSVTERTREIGIRMAVGAKENDILLQFLVEAVVLSLIGGIIGIMLGWGSRRRWRRSRSSRPACRFPACFCRFSFRRRSGYSSVFIPQRKRRGWTRFQHCVTSSIGNNRHTREGGYPGI